MAVAIPALMAVGSAAAVAGTVLSATAASRAGRVSGDTAVLNSQLRSKELISQAQMSENQALLAEREAKTSEYAAQSEREATAEEVTRQATQGRAFLSQQRADIGGSGLEATGSPLLVMAESAKQLELDRLAMTRAGEVKARAYEDEARMSRYGGELATYQAQQLRQGIPLTLDIGRYQARAARQAGQLGAVSSLISGGGRLAASYYGAGLYGSAGYGRKTPAS